MIVLYTAIVGEDCPDLPSVACENPEIRCLLFTDKVFESTAGWEVLPVDPLRAIVSGHPRRLARAHKILAQEVLPPETTVSIWLDGNHFLKPILAAEASKPAWDLILSDFSDEMPGSCRLKTFRHSRRNCVYQEAQACIQLGKDDPQVIRSQIDRYHADGYPYHNGLAETTCVIRKHCEQTSDFNMRWWAQLCQGSFRDQLSFDYTLWSANRPKGWLDFLPGTAWENVFFGWKAH